MSSRKRAGRPPSPARWRSSARLHGLLNAAGVGVRNSIEDCTLAEYRRVNDINSLGTFLGCKHAIPAMKAAGGGSIVNISSVLGLRGASYAMAYCASQGRGAHAHQERGAALCPA